MHRFSMGLAAGITLAAILGGCPPARAQSDDAELGASAQGLLDAGRRLSPALRAASLDTEAAAARAAGADALDDPTITDSYQYYKDPGVFSAHTVLLSQAFPLWGKRGLRRQAALADVEASRGREQAATDALDEAIKVAYAQYFALTRDLDVNRQVASLASRMRAAAAARYGQGGGEAGDVIDALAEATAASAEAIRLRGEQEAARAHLNVLIGRPADAPLADPVRPRALPATDPVLAELVVRSRATNPTLAAETAAVQAAQTRSTLADKAWYPDVTVGAGPLIQTNDRPVGFAATVGFNIPLPWGHEASGQRDAAAELAATRLRYDAARLEIEGALAEAVARLRSARDTIVLLQRESMPQAKAAFQSVLAGYAQGRGQLTTAIAAEHRMHDVELRQLQAQLNAQIELAAIERLIGGDL